LIFSRKIGYDQLCAKPRDTGVEVSLRNESGKNGATKCMRRAQPIAETGERIAGKRGNLAAVLVPATTTEPSVNSREGAKTIKCSLLNEAASDVNR
jgi:hypothetical protein